MTVRNDLRPRRAWLTALIAAGVLALAGVWFALQGSRPADGQLSQELMEAAAGLDSTVIEAELHPESRSMKVIQTLTLTSRAEEARQEIVLRTWPNAFLHPDTSPIAGDTACLPDGFSAGSLVMETLEVDRGGAAEAAAYRYGDDARTVLTVPLSETWAAGEPLTVRLCYTVNFPHAMYRFGWWEDTFMAGHAFVTPALWQEGAYRTDAWQTLGDPLSGECINVSLRLTLPEGYRCAAGGTVTAGSQEGGSSVWCIEAPAVRELGLVMSKGLKAVSRSIGGVQVQALAENKAQAGRLLDTASEALKAYSERYGSYPWPVYTVCALPLGVDGAEYTALAMVSQKLEGTRQEYAVAHETAHQWWYALVGSDSQTHPWLDEALCEYSLLDYVESRYGSAAREELRQSRIEPSMRITVAGQATPGAPLDYFETASDYQMLVYGRAAAFLCAADELLSGGLDDVLSRWAEKYAFAIADRAAFARLVLEESGVDIEPLMVDYLDTYLIN